MPRTIKKRQLSVPAPVKDVAKDIVSGVGELKRQTGSAVERIKSGYRKIKQATKR